MRLALRYGLRMPAEIVVWAVRSGRVWLVLVLPLLIVAAALATGAHVVVPTAVYTLF